MTSRAYRRLGSGQAFLVARLDVRPLEITFPSLVPGDVEVFQMKETVGLLAETHASDICRAEKTGGTPQHLLHGQGLSSSYEILVEASYQRELDLKQFRQTKSLLVDWLEAGTPYLADAAMSQLGALSKATDTTTQI